MSFFPSTESSGSPMAALVTEWRAFPFRPPLHRVTELRAALYEACFKEIRWAAENGYTYDPANDHRVTWAHQALQVIARERRSVDSGIEAVIDFMFGETLPETSHQHSAANDC